MFSIDSEQTCKAKASYYGPEACKSFSVNLQKISDQIAPFITWIFLAIGLILTFAGSRFLLYAVAFLCCLLVSFALYLFSYNTFMDEKSATTGGVVGIMIVALLAGILAGWLAFKFAKAWAVSLLAAWAGIAVFVPLTKVLGLTKTYFTIGGAVIGACIGFYVGKRFNKEVRSVGTAIVGSFLTVRSLGSYIGGYPNETDLVDGATKGQVTYDPAIIGYIAGMIVLAIIGTIVQMKFFKEEVAEGDKENEFSNEEESKRCGCL